MADAILDFEFNCHFKGYSGQKDRGACCTSVTVGPKMTVTPCPTRLPNTLPILFNVLCKIYNAMLMTTPINEKQKNHEL